MGHLFIFLTVALTVYGQIVIKWQVASAGSFPSQVSDKFWFLLKLLLNPWVVSSFFCAFLAALSWMLAVSKFPLSYAYPFTGLSFALVLLSSALLFQEAMTLPKLVGTALVIAGIVIGSRG